MNPIYLDFNASTPLEPLVLEKMQACLKDCYGNASSVHWAGRNAKNRLLKARESVASLFNADSSEILFTSSGTESVNQAIKGSFWAYPFKRHFITTAVEHPATLETFKWLEKRGAEVSYLSVNREGGIDLAQLSDSIRPDTNLISIMFANHETGVLFPIKELSEIAKSRGVIFHCDATQAVGKINIDLNELPIDLLSLSAHKFYGPKGVGALIVSPGTVLEPIIHGGGQERNRRGGTESIPQIIGFGVASDIAKSSIIEVEIRLRELQHYLEAKLEVLDGVIVIGKRMKRVPNTTMIIVEGVLSESMLLNLDLHGIAVSSGAACSSGKLEPSKVLIAMGYSKTEASTSIRISYGKHSTEDELDKFIKVFSEVCGRLRNHAKVQEFEIRDFNISNIKQNSKSSEVNVHV